MGSHIVQPGETLASIAYLYGLTVEALLLANNLVSPYIIYPGQVLFIPVYYGPQYQPYPYPAPYPAPYPYHEYHPYHESPYHPRPRPRPRPPRPYRES